MESQDHAPSITAVTSGQHRTPRSVWQCKIGVLSPVNLPAGCDFPMRRAIDAAFLSLAGVESDFIFSGWGAKLTEGELAVVENRIPSEAYYRELRVRDAAPALLEALRELHEKTVIGTDAERHAALHKAWAAISKAEGL